MHSCKGLVQVVQVVVWPTGNGNAHIKVASLRAVSTEMVDHSKGLENITDSMFKNITNI